jgi:hypothetical protein
MAIEIGGRQNSKVSRKMVPGKHLQIGLLELRCLDCHINFLFFDGISMPCNVGLDDERRVSRVDSVVGAV